MSTTDTRRTYHVTITTNYHIIISIIITISTTTIIIIISITVIHRADTCTTARQMSTANTRQTCTHDRVVFITGHKIQYTRFPVTSPYTGKLSTCCGLVSDTANKSL